MKHSNLDRQAVSVNQQQIDAIKSGLAEIMQGCMTLTRVLTLSQVPESATNRETPSSLKHDAHVQCYEQHKADLANSKQASDESEQHHRETETSGS